MHGQESAQPPVRPIRTRISISRPKSSGQELGNMDAISPLEHPERCLRERAMAPEDWRIQRWRLTRRDIRIWNCLPRCHADPCSKYQKSEPSCTSPRKNSSLDAEQACVPASHLASVSLEETAPRSWDPAEIINNNQDGHRPTANRPRRHQVR